MRTKTYRFVEMSHHGGPEVLMIKSAPLLSPEKGEVCVRVLACGVSFGDVLNRVGIIPGGSKPPCVPGYDIAGVVEAVGEGVSQFRPGQIVAALLHSGGYAEYAQVPGNRLVAVPDGVDPVDAAAVALNYYVALQMLHRVARVQKGQRILVHSAAGGVGTAFLQLGQLSSMLCYGTCSRAKQDTVERFGGRPIDYHAQDFVAMVRAAERGGIEAAFDPIGGGNFRRSYKVLRRGGTLVAYGMNAALRDGRVHRGAVLSGFLGGLVLPKLVPDGKMAVFYNAWSVERRQPEAYRQDLGEVLRLLAGGKIHPLVAERLPLANAAKAHALLEKGAIAGKLVLTP